MEEKDFWKTGLKIIFIGWLTIVLLLGTIYGFSYLFSTLPK